MAGSKPPIVAVPELMKLPVILMVGKKPLVANEPLGPIDRVPATVSVCAFIVKVDALSPVPTVRLRHAAAVPPTVG